LETHTRLLAVDDFVSRRPPTSTNHWLSGDHESFFHSGARKVSNILAWMAAALKRSGAVFAENRSEKDGSTTSLEASSGAPCSMRLDQIIRSDSLPDMSALCERHVVLQQVVDKTLQIRLVLDANIVQRELRWRVGSRQKQGAKTGLHEAIEAQVVIALAPTVLEEEINDHVAKIAKDERVSEDRVREEWAEFRQHIHFYEPELTEAASNCIDPDDVPYKQTCIELGAHAVYTKDRHFQSMEVPLLMVDLDGVFRKYARANSVKLAFTLGSTFSVTISVSVLKELLTLSMRGIRRIPTPLKIAFGAAIAAALIHPKSRAKIIGLSKTLWNKLNNPKLRALLSSLVMQLAEAHEDARLTASQIKAALPMPRKRTALVYAREICLIEGGPITLKMMEVKIRKAGYVSRSRDFASYLRRVLRGSPTFVEVSSGTWALRVTSVDVA
jgi:predicted nucleic acid-binding protein